MDSLRTDLRTIKTFGNILLLSILLSSVVRMTTCASSREVIATTKITDTFQDIYLSESDSNSESHTGKSTITTKWTFSYNNSGLLSVVTGITRETTLFSNGTKKTTYTSKRQKYRFYYTSTGMLSKIKCLSPKKYTITFAYDEYGRAVEMYNSSTKLTVIYSYRKKSSKYPSSASCTKNGLSVSYKFNRLGLLKSSTGSVEEGAGVYGSSWDLDFYYNKYGFLKFVPFLGKKISYKSKSGTLDITYSYNDGWKHTGVISRVKKKMKNYSIAKKQKYVVNALATFLITEEELNFELLAFIS